MGWNHNRHYERTLLRRISPCDLALDAGCGDGWLTRSLAGRCRHVIGIDRDPAIIAAARASTPAEMAVEFVLGDMLDPPRRTEYDLVVAVASIHHIGSAEAFAALGHILASGGRLVVLGLYRPNSLVDGLWAIASLLADGWLRLGLTHEDAAAAQAAPRENYSEVRRNALAQLPGAKLRRLLLFRYLLEWNKPECPD